MKLESEIKEHRDSNGNHITLPECNDNHEQGNHTSCERNRMKSASLPQSCRSLSLLTVDDSNRLRISKSTECLNPTFQPETAVMLMPESLSLEDIFANNQRLLNPSDVKKGNDLKTRLLSRLKGFKENF